MAFLRCAAILMLPLPLLFNIVLKVLIHGQRYTVLAWETLQLTFAA